MGLFSGQYEREGAGRPMPEGGAARYFAVLFSQFWKLVGANLLFVLFSLPIVTLPAALCALDRVCLLLYSRGYCFLWQDFLGQFRESLVKSLPPTLLFLLLCLFGYYSMSLGLTNAALPLWSMLFWLVGILATVAGICWGGYYYVLSAMQALDNKQLMKNARLLCMIRPGKAFSVLLVVLAALGLTAGLMPVSLVLVALIIPALCQYSVTFLVYELAEEFVISEE